MVMLKLLCYEEFWYDMGMKLYANAISVIVSVVVGGIIGYLGGPAIVLIAWALIGILLGIFCASRRSALLNGAVYGFALAYVFMVAGYNGQDPIHTKLLPFVIFGIVGALGGSTLAIIGLFVKGFSKSHRV